MALTIIVSNRLPVVVKKVDGKLVYERSIGGVATGLADYTRDNQSIWIGWPYIVEEELTSEDRVAITRKLKSMGCVPVFLSQKQIDSFYTGYSNSILWPMFHDLPLKITDSKKYWPAYKEVNQQFAEAIINVLKANSIIWIHDYQLMLVPSMVREHMTKDASIGFFSHIPFPSFKSFSRLPESKTLLRGMLGAGLVGFHTTSYSKNFLDTCKGFNTGVVLDGQVALSNRVVKVAEFPIGIDYEKYAQAMKTKQVKYEIAKLKKKYRKYRIILTFDRFDISKGFIERLKAYGELLRTHPELRKKVQLVMLAAPSRTDVQAYQDLKKQVDKLVSEINITYGTAVWEPIDFIFRTILFEELTAYYQIADVAFITPTKDGMNLIAKEFVAGQQKHHGVLVLSQTAGAAEELNEAVLVNPKRPDSMLAGLEQALSMPKKILKKQLRIMQKTLANNTAQSWAKGFIDSMETATVSNLPLTIHLNRKRMKGLAADYKNARRRWIFLDYDGTLAEFKSDPGKTPLPVDTRSLIQKLSEDTKNTVVVISGRPQKALDEYLKGLSVGMAAEHGAFIKRDDVWHTTVEVDHSWKHVVRPLMEAYASKTPGAWVEDKKYTLVWHYRNVSAYQAKKNLTILKYVLRPEIRHLGVKAYDGKKVLEVKPPSVNKGSALRTWLHGHSGFCIVLGDDYTDEDMFMVAPKDAYTIKVGPGATTARYRLKTTKAVQELLTKLAG